MVTVAKEHDLKIVQKVIENMIMNFTKRNSNNDRNVGSKNA